MPNDAEPDTRMQQASHHPVGTEELLTLTERARARAEEDPFGNPVLAVALAINRLMDEGDMEPAHIAGLIAELRDDAFAGRAKRLAAYVGGLDEAAARHSFENLATRLVRPDPDDSPVPLKQFRESVERIRFAAVFTAHPTFALPAPVFAELAQAASGRPSGTSFASHRPSRPTLTDEFDQLYAEAATRRRMMVIAMHDRVSGHAARVRALDRFLTYARGHNDVWFARKDEIARWALQTRTQTPVVERGPAGSTGLPGPSR